MLDISQRQVYHKNRALPYRRLDLHMAVMHDDDIAHDSQSQPRAAGLTCPGLVRAVKTLKNVRQVLRLDATARILYTDLDAIAGRQPCAYCDRTAFWRVFYRVGQDIDHSSLQLA